MPKSGLSACGGSPPRRILGRDHREETWLPQGVLCNHDAIASSARNSGITWAGEIAVCIRKSAKDSQSGKLITVAIWTGNTTVAVALVGAQLLTLEWRISSIVHVSLVGEWTQKAVRVASEWSDSRRQCRQRLWSDTGGRRCACGRTAPRRRTCRG